MKKCLVSVLLLLLVFSLFGCGEKAAVTETKNYDFSVIFPHMLEMENMPEMLLVPADKAEILYGVQSGKCVQEYIAICQDSLRADEIWLIEATDSDAAKEIEEYAKTRIAQKSAELKNYLPEEYAVVQKAELIKTGNYVILIISPLKDEISKLLN